MIIRGWSIDGYGLFRGATRRGLGDGLTVILGPNESGKSTLLAFVRGVLFGFPDRRSREPLHEPLNGGRHGGRLFLEIDQGPVTVEREAGRLRPPLVTLPDGAEGGEAELREILGGVDLRVFRNVFAFGLDELNDLAGLNADGAGRRLIAAGITGAGRSASDLLDVLSDEAATLLRPRGRSAIGDTLEQLVAAEQQIATARSDLAEHPGLVRREEEVSRALDELTSELKQARETEKRLERLLEIWPHWHRRRQALERLALMPVPDTTARPDQRLEQLADRLERTEGPADGMEPAPGWMPPAWLAPLLLILASATAAGSVFLGLQERWPVAGPLALGAAAMALGSLAAWRRRNAFARQQARERERQRVEADARTAAAARDLAAVRRSLDQTADRRALEQAIRQADELVAIRVGGDERAAGFIRELESGSLGDWEQRLLEIRNRQEELVNSRDQVIRDLETHRRQRESLELAADLPTLENDAAGLNCRLTDELEQWRLLALARGLVEDALGAFCADRQPLVLQRASALFRTVTDGRYRQLVQEPGGSEPVLIAEDGRRLAPAALSRGATEQLYLCQRLALADDAAGRGTPLPLLLDDVLVNADPERAEGMAAAIADYAGGGRQVLLFTCHPQTAALLERIDGETDLLRLEG